MSDSFSHQHSTPVPAAAPAAVNPASAPAPADYDVDALILAWIEGESRGPPALTPELAALPDVVALRALVESETPPLTVDALAAHFVDKVVPLYEEHLRAGVDGVASVELVYSLRLCVLGWSLLALGSVDGGTDAIVSDGEEYEVMTLASLSRTDPVQAATDLAQVIAFPCNCPDPSNHHALPPLTNNAIRSVIDWLTHHLSIDPTLPSSTTDPLAHFALYLIDLTNMADALHQEHVWHFQPAIMQLRVALPKPPGALLGIAGGYRAQLLAAMADFGAQSVDALVDLIEATGVVAFSNTFAVDLLRLADCYAAAARNSGPASSSAAATSGSTRPLPPITVVMVDANTLAHTVDLTPHLDHPWFALHAYGSPEARFRWQRTPADPSATIGQYHVAPRNEPGEVSTMMALGAWYDRLLADPAQPALIVSAEESVHNIQWLAMEKRQQVAGAAPVCVVASELGLLVMASFLKFVITGHDPVLASHARWAVEEGAQELAPVASEP